MMKSNRMEEWKMTFFDEFSRKASKVAAKTVHKTQEIAETARLNMQISELHKKVMELYTKLGKEYFSLHAYDYEETLAEIVNNILDTLNEIDELKTSVQNIQKQRTCPKCGTQISIGAAFCSSCGYEISVATENNEYVFCENCGEQIKKEMKYCTACGNPMRTNTNNNEKLQKIEYENNVDFNSEKSADNFNINDLEMEKDIIAEKIICKVCPNCGAKMDNDMVFCTECGTKILDEN